jgi:hypothetical protein
VVALPRAFPFADRGLKLSDTVLIPALPRGVDNIGAVEIAFSPKSLIFSQTSPIVHDAWIAAKRINRIIQIPEKQIIIQENQSPVAPA